MYIYITLQRYAGRQALVQQHNSAHVDNCQTSSKSLSRQESPLHQPLLAKRCMTARCQICEVMDARPSLKIKGADFIVRPGNYNCNSSNVVYLIKCKKCDSDNYIGEASTIFRLRMNNHKKHRRQQQNTTSSYVSTNRTTQSLTLNAIYCMGTFLTAQAD